jgi:hypothetical protein
MIWLPAIWILCALATAWIAWTRGGNPAIWATVGLFFGPLGILFAMHEFPGGREAVEDEPGWEAGCPAVDPSGRSCSLAEGHEGSHRA